MCTHVYVCVYTRLVSFPYLFLISLLSISLRSISLLMRSLLTSSPPPLLRDGGLGALLGGGTGGGGGLGTRLRIGLGGLRKGGLRLSPPLEILLTGLNLETIRPLQKDQYQ